MRLDYWKLGTISYKLTMFLFMFAIFLSNRTYYGTKFFFISAFLALGIGTICLWNERRRIHFYLAIQMLPIFLLVSIFWLLTIVNNIAIKYDFHYKFAICGLVILLFASFFWLHCVFMHKREFWWRIKKYLEHNGYIFLSVLLFLILYLDCFTFLFKSDSHTYYTTSLNCLNGWNFSLSDLEQFKLGYHLTYGYSIFTCIGNYLFPNDGIGIRVINFLLMVQTIFFANGINKKLFPKQNKYFYFFLILFFLFNPLVLGLIQEMNIDMPLMVFYIWVVWAYVNKKEILLIFFSFLFGFSKENALVVLAGLVIGLLLYRFIMQIKEKRVVNVFRCINRYEWYVVLVPIYYLICSFCLGNQWGAESAVGTEPQLGLLNSFQFNLEYILFRLKQMCILNFQWLVILLGVIFIIYVILKRIKIHLEDFHFAIIVSAIFYNLFQLLYFTYSHYRYCMLNAFFTEILIGCIVFYTFKNLRAKCSILTILCMLFLGQLYIPIDFIGNSFFKMASTGNGKIVSLSYYGSSENPNVMISEEQGANLYNEKYRDYVQHSRQYLRFEKCFEKALKEIEYNETKGIVIVPLYDDPYWGKINWTFVNLFGVVDPNLLYFNTNTKQLSFNENNNVINWIPYNDLQTHYGNFEEIWMIEFPYETIEPSNYPSDYKVIEKRVVFYGEWKINLYCLKK